MFYKTEPNAFLLIPNNTGIITNGDYMFSGCRPYNSSTSSNVGIQLSAAEFTGRSVFSGYSSQGPRNIKMNIPIIHSFREAFKNCTNLRTVNFADLTSVDTDAFIDMFADMFQGYANYLSYLDTIKYHLLFDIGISLLFLLH